ncbi:MAG: hypothetical protein JWP15_3659 [Alphaproteobacteria bacterium]|nr:hypothetical protein [Alphaproteobacteria bacterium]
MNIRLASSVLVGALIRTAEGEGGFGAVLAKGDATAGSVIVILLERGANPLILERILQPDGDYAWTQPSAESPDVPEFVARRRRFDRDLWVLELDVPAQERFAAGMNAFD